MLVRSLPLLFASSLILSCGPGEEFLDDELATETTGSFLTAPQPIPGKYLVTLNDANLINVDLDVVVFKLAQRYNGTVGHTYRSALRGFSAAMSEADARALAREPWVARVEEDSLFKPTGAQTNATQGLDRIDQTAYPLNQTFNYPSSGGAGVRIYIIDSGLRATHSEFTGRVLPGRDALNNDNTPEDCSGHGTHVAGTAAGTTYGVAKSAYVIGVKVFGCSGGASASIIAGLDWVAANAVLPAVANMSLGGSANETMDTAVRALIDKGVVVVVAAGNDTIDASLVSPARELRAITVGAMRPWENVRAPYSNYGTALDLFAPGSDITSAGHTSDTATSLQVGTSMAAPHVTGAAALYLRMHPTASPQRVHDALVNNSEQGVLANILTGSPNRVLNIRFIDRFIYSAVNTNNARVNTTTFTVNLRAGDRFVVGTCGVPDSTFTGDSYLWLLGPQGDVLQSDDGCATGAGSRIDYTAQFTGAHQIIAGCYQNTACTGTVVWTVN